jgi:hypothetical protein
MKALGGVAGVVVSNVEGTTSAQDTAEDVVGEISGGFDEPISRSMVFSTRCEPAASLLGHVSYMNV